MLQEHDLREVYLKILNDSECLEFRKALESFIRDYGHRSYTREIYFPRWAETPWVILEIIRSLLESDLDLEKVQLQKKEQSEKALTTALNRVGSQRFGFIKKIIFKRIYLWAKQYLIFREKQRFYLDHQLYRFRKIFLAYGRHLIGKGLDKPEDIFFLYLDEIEKVKNGLLPASEVKKMVKARKEEFFKYMNVIPPKFLKGNLEFDERLSQKIVKKLKGIPISPGIVEGKVRVILDIKELPTIHKDEILVTHGTDPGWTPIFAKIKGLITEIGGLLSHGAVVSREFGIPAVSGVKEATKKLKTGLKVLVDGYSGVITILED